jgi:hypothetical protein
LSIAVSIIQQAKAFEDMTREKENILFTAIGGGFWQACIKSLKRMGTYSISQVEKTGEFCGYILAASTHYRLSTELALKTWNAMQLKGLPMSK